MGPWYGYEPPHPKHQHRRIVALRWLTSRGIPCILWGEDALNFVHCVPTSLFDQQILVPDELLESASAVLCEEGYVTVQWTSRYADYGGAGELLAPTAFPRGVLFELGDLNTLEPLPMYILLLPQSYFGLDVRSKERFQSLVPPLDPSNADILAPKYHTFLEGLVAFNIDPPIPHATQHFTQRLMHDHYIGYLLRYRVQYEVDGDPLPPGELLPEERVILSELRTEEAIWYITKYMLGRPPGYNELKEYHCMRALESNPPATEKSLVVASHLSQ